VSPNDEDDFGQWMSQLQHQYSISDKVQWSNTIYYSGAGGHFPAGFQDAEGNFTQIDYPLFNDHFGAMSNLSGRSANYNFRWNVGVHAYTFLRTNEEAIVPNYTSPYYRDQSQKEEIAAFVKIEQKWNRWRLFADAQLRSVLLDLEADEDFLGMMTSIPDRDWLFFNPKIGLSYKTGKASQLYASLGRTGREPTRFDILGSTQINSSNLDLVNDPGSVKAEYVNDLELGYRYRTAKLQYQINAFYMQFENEIAPIGAFIPEGFVQIYENQEQSRRYGIELDFLWNISSQWKWRGNATWMQAEISQYTDAATDVTFDNVTPILSPEWNIQNTLSFHPHEQTTLGIRLRYLGEQFMELTNDENLKVPSSWVSDFFVQYQFTSFLRANIQLNNIFDELYYTYGAPVSGAQGMTEPGYFVQPPRHVYASLHFIF
jgi:iron complex outermembrane receptor protein